MHELDIALSLAETASESACEAGMTQVLVVRVSLGTLCGVDAESLISAWEITRDRPQLESAELRCEVVPVKIFCQSCNRTVQPDDCWRLICPVCQTPSADVRAGRELLLTQLEGV